MKVFYGNVKVVDKAIFFMWKGIYVFIIEVNDYVSDYIIVWKILVIIRESVWGVIIEFLLGKLIFYLYNNFVVYNLSFK